MDNHVLMHTLAGRLSKPCLAELAGALYDASSSAFSEPNDTDDAEQEHDALERWQELRDLAEYVARIADATPERPSALERRRAARFEVIGRYEA